VRAVRQLLPFWGFSGLYLLLFSHLDQVMEHRANVYDNRKISRFFHVLMEHGGVPHGTEIYNEITRFLAASNSMCQDAFHRIQSKILMLI
jgi:hypothetical protein